MTTFYLIPLKSGISVHVGELPGKPKFMDTSDRYEDEIQDCIDNAILCANQDQAEKIIWNKDIKFEENYFYGPFSGEIEFTEVLSDGWVPTYNDPDNSGGHPNAEPITVAFITLTKDNKVVESPEERIEDLTLLLEAAKSGCDQRDKIIEELENKLSLKVVPEMIFKIHEDIEGRYNLDSYDKGVIHALLCKLQK